jgi:hypothetical protein
VCAWVFGNETSNESNQTKANSVALIKYLV